MVVGEIWDIKEILDDVICGVGEFVGEYCGVVCIL